MRWHLHSDPDWQQEGAWRYFVCRRCGARRVVRAYVNMMGPVKRGWEGMTNDGHGRTVWDSGWRKAP